MAAVAFISHAEGHAMAAGLNELFFKNVGRHFLTLSCVQLWPGSATETTRVFSGFLIDAGGVWFFVTAGHILRDIRKALNAGAKFECWRLGDQTAAGSRFKNTAIPFAFDSNDWAVIENEAIGLDYAAVPLDTMYCRALHVGGALPLGEDAWGDHVTDHDQWALVGIPSETVSYDGRTIIEARVVLAPLEKVDRPPPAAGEKAQNQFYGQLQDDSARMVKDIDGMSGGPIFAIKKVDDTWRYAVIGVQSGWYPQSRIIAACPFPSFARALADVVTDARTTLQRGETNP